ncbi:hypothetical protein BE20_18390 [Sorangium cellulosum]|nr:hypothetical protein BE20_18390 [Sorangium cellulosum]
MFGLRWLKKCQVVHICQFKFEASAKTSLAEVMSRQAPARLPRFARAVRAAGSRAELAPKSGHTASSGAFAQHRAHHGTEHEQPAGPSRSAATAAAA